MITGLTNHIAPNLITKGFLYSFPLTDGFLLDFEYEIIIPTGETFIRKTGSGGYKGFIEEVNKHKEIGAIKVYVDWWKKTSRDKKITAELMEVEIKKKIYADIISENKKDIKIEVKIIK